MLKTKIMLLLVGLLLCFNVNCLAAEEYDDELVIPIGMTLPLDDVDIVSYEYDEQSVALRQEDGKEVPYIKKEGDTVITFNIKVDKEVVPMRVLIHAVGLSRYELIVDDAGNIKPQFKNDIYGKGGKPATSNPVPVKKEPVQKKEAVTPDFAQEVLSLVNEERAKAGVGPLRLANDLQEEANIRVEELISLFSHTRPDGRECFSVMSNQGRICAENIAAGQQTPAGVMDSWMNSSGHRANILNGALKELGVGFVKREGTEYDYYWVQLFRG